MHFHSHVFRQARPTTERHLFTLSTTLKLETIALTVIPLHRLSRHSLLFTLPTRSTLTTTSTSTLYQPTTTTALFCTVLSFNSNNPLTPLSRTYTKVTRNTNILHIRRRKMNIHKFKKRRRLLRMSTRHNMSKKRKSRPLMLKERKEIADLMEYFKSIKMI